MKIDMRFKPQLLTKKDSEKMQHVFINSHVVLSTNSYVLMAYQNEDWDDMTYYGIMPEGYDMLQKQFKSMCYIEIDDPKDTNPFYQITHNDFVKQQGEFYYDFLHKNIKELMQESRMTILLNMDLLNKIAKSTNQKTLKLSVPDLFQTYELDTKRGQESSDTITATYNGVDCTVKALIFDDDMTVDNTDFAGMYMLSFRPTNVGKLDKIGDKLFVKWNNDPVVDFISEVMTELIEPEEDIEDIENIEPEEN